MSGAARPITVTAVDRAVAALERIVKAPDYEILVGSLARRDISHTIDTLCSLYTDLPAPRRI